MFLKSEYKDFFLEELEPLYIIVYCFYLLYYLIIFSEITKGQNLYTIICIFIIKFFTKNRISVKSFLKTQSCNAKL